MSNPVKCFCGRDPEVNTKTIGKMRFSLSCRCGGNWASVFVRSDDQDKVYTLWGYLVANRLGNAEVAKNTTQETPTTGEEQLPFTPMVVSTPFGSHMFWGA